MPWINVVEIQIDLKFTSFLLDFCEEKFWAVATVWLLLTSRNFGQVDKTEYILILTVLVWFKTQQCLKFKSRLAEKKK
jgi:hypothetical protein